VPGAGDVVGGAVIGRRAHDRQPERDVHRLVEVDQLDRDQALIVVHRDHRVVAAVDRVAERRVGDERAEQRGRRARLLERGRDDVGVLVAEQAVLAGVRVQADDADARR
jgi:hypothetical protein